MHKHPDCFCSFLAFLEPNANFLGTTFVHAMLALENIRETPG